MATPYQLKTFADIVAAIREEVGVQSTDSVSINRIKRDVNTIYLEEIVPFARWRWLNREIPITKEAKFDTGSASVVSGVASITLSEIPAINFTNYWFAVKGDRIRYRIRSHTENTSVLYLENEYIGPSNTQRRFTIWTDNLDLPVDCREVVEVRHDMKSSGLENSGLQEFLKVVNQNPQAEAMPAYYTVSDYIDASPTASIATLPPVLSRSSNGLLKSLIFSASLGTVSSTQLIIEGQHIAVSGAGHYSYNTPDVMVAAIGTTNVANDTVSYLGTAKKYESLVSDTSIAVQQFKEATIGNRHRRMTLFPSIYMTPTIIRVNYIREVQPLINDLDEPAIPVEDRVVLLYGALARAWFKQRNPESSQYNEALFKERLGRMKAKWEDSLEKGQMVVNNDYINKQRRARRSINTRYFNTGPDSSGGSVSPQGTPNRVTVFDNTGRMSSDSLIDVTELHALDNITGNIQDQLDAITDLTDYLVDTEELQSVVLADNSSGTAEAWAVASYDIVRVAYSIKRGAAIEDGTLTIASDGSTAAYAIGGVASIGVHGVTLSADVSGASLRLNWATTSTGSPATLRYKLHKWKA